MCLYLILLQITIYTNHEIHADLQRDSFEFHSPPNALTGRTLRQVSSKAQGGPLVCQGGRLCEYIEIGYNLKSLFPSIRNRIILPFCQSHFTIYYNNALSKLRHINVKVSLRFTQYADFTGISRLLDKINLPGDWIYGGYSEVFNVRQGRPSGTTLLNVCGNLSVFSSLQFKIQTSNRTRHRGWNIPSWTYGHFYILKMRPSLRVSKSEKLDDLPISIQVL